MTSLLVEGFNPGEICSQKSASSPSFFFGKKNGTQLLMLGNQWQVCLLGYMACAATILLLGTVINPFFEYKDQNLKCTTWKLVCCSRNLLLLPGIIQGKIVLPAYFSVNCPCSLHDAVARQKQNRGAGAERESRVHRHSTTDTARPNQPQPV